MPGGERLGGHRHADVGVEFGRGVGTTPFRQRHKIQKDVSQWYCHVFLGVTRSHYGLRCRSASLRLFTGRLTEVQDPTLTLASAHLTNVRIKTPRPPPPLLAPPCRVVLSRRSPSGGGSVARRRDPAAP